MLGHEDDRPPRPRPRVGADDHRGAVPGCREPAGEVVAVPDLGRGGAALYRDGAEHRSCEGSAPDDDDVRRIGPDGASVAERVPDEHRSLVVDGECSDRVR
ncbi:hypothetical protein ACRQ4C_10050 [Curtobacterium sp. SP.BCp]|uniref:hypothetical protein n=1 Tax=Curtobacterium sp. SP.BCp TaxID=3435230 RepID=UPI003F7411A0